MMQVLDALRDLIYPVRCPFCDEVLGTLRECPVCKASAETLFHRPFRLAETEHQLELVEGAASLYEYDGCVQQAIQRMKFSGRGMPAGSPMKWRRGCSGVLSGRGVL